MTKQERTNQSAHLGRAPADSAQRRLIALGANLVAENSVSELKAKRAAVPLVAKTASKSRVDESAAEGTESEEDGDQALSLGQLLAPVFELSRQHLVVLVLLCLAAGVFAVVKIQAAQGSQQLPANQLAASPSFTPLAPPSPSAPAKHPVLVHVIGAVQNPGVVELASGARVADAIEAAGGLTKTACLGELNLATKLSDGWQLKIANCGDQEATTELRGAQANSPGGAPLSAGGQIDLNSATADQLDQLPGVGPVTAANILAWRQANGRFNSVAQLQEIDGIGPKSYERLAPLVRVD